jgi:hypothetical protein
MTSSATFKCKISGHTVTFTAPVDIQSMKGHYGYEEVVTQQETPKEVLTPKKTINSKKSVDTPAEE